PDPPAGVAAGAPAAGAAATWLGAAQEPSLISIWPTGHVLCVCAALTSDGSPLGALAAVWVSALWQPGRPSVRAIVASASILGKESRASSDMERDAGEVSVCLSFAGSCMKGWTPTAWQGCPPMSAALLKGGDQEAGGLGRSGSRGE